MAVTDKKIVESNTETILQALRYAMLKIGLRAANLPNEQETAILVAHIIQNYCGHTPAEIRLAFDLAISDKLDVKDVNCYENFSCLYFSNIMNAYRSWAKEAHKHVVKEVPKIEASKEMTDEETQTFINSYKNQNTDVRLLPEFLYQWLVDRSRITTLWDQEANIQNAIALRKSEIMKGLEIEPSNRILMNERSELKRMLAQGFLEGNEVGRIQSLAKKILIREYLNGLG